MRCRLFIAITAFAVVYSPASALADVGTPLVWGSAFHLLLGNAAIGCFEGWLLARYLKLPWPRPVWPLIVANYCSAWLGTLLLPFLFDCYATDIYVVGRVIGALIFFSFLLTLVIEWPFVYRAIPKGRRRLQQSLRGSLVIQSVSYVILFGTYFALSGTSLLTKFDRVPTNQLSLPAGVQVFYISQGDGNVYSFTTPTAPDRKVFNLGSTNVWDRLGLRDSIESTNAWDLIAFRDRLEDGRVVVPHISSEDRISAVDASFLNRYYGWGIRPHQIGEATNSAWRFGWAHWPDVGMWAQRRNERVRLALGTPFGGWSPLRVVHLPGDLAMLQLGTGQVCLVDMPRRKISLLRRGYGFVALHDHGSTSDAALAQVRCGNQLSSICVAARLWAGENAGTLPLNFHELGPELGTPSLLICPMDRMRKPADSWAAWNETNTSYVIVTPALPESDSETVYIRCLACGTQGFAEGTVNDGTGRRRKTP